MCYFGATWYPFFGDVSCGFQSQRGLCLIHIAEANIMYIPWDPPPLVLNVVYHLTVRIVGITLR